MKFALLPLIAALVLPNVALAKNDGLLINCNPDDRNANYYATLFVGKTGLLEAGTMLVDGGHIEFGGYGPATLIGTQNGELSYRVVDGNDDLIGVVVPQGVNATQKFRAKLIFKKGPAAMVTCNVKSYDVQSPKRRG